MPNGGFVEPGNSGVGGGARLGLIVVWAAIWPSSRLNHGCITNFDALLSAQHLAGASIIAANYLKVAMLGATMRMFNKNNKDSSVAGVDGVGGEENVDGCMRR